MTTLAPIAPTGGSTPPVSAPGTHRPRSIDRTVARVVGVIYLAGMVIGVGGDLLIQSTLRGPDHLSAIAATTLPIALGATLWLATVAGDVAHGVLMLPILQRRSERMAVGYLAARILDATFIAVMVLLIVAQIPVARAYRDAAPADASTLAALSTILDAADGYAYFIAMTTVGVAGLILCTVFLRTGLVPRVLAWWGLGGYTVLLGGSVLGILGHDLGLVQALPGGLWELFIGVWLIVKGFSPDARFERTAG